MSTPRTIKLPNGRRLESWNPVREFEKNLRNRRGVLFHSERADRLTAEHLTNLWERDAINRRRGILRPVDRAAALGIATAELTAFDNKVRELERDIWKKAADFYSGMLDGKLFEQTVVVHGGLYHDHQFWTWSQVQEKFGVSRATAFRRIKAGAKGIGIIEPVRAKARASALELGGKIYTLLEFAATFRVSKQHVRDGMARGLSAEEILEAPRRCRGRPRKHPTGGLRVVLEELKISAEVVTPETM